MAEAVLQMVLRIHGRERPLLSVQSWCPRLCVYVYVMKQIYNTTLGPGIGERTNQDGRSMSYSMVGIRVGEEQSVQSWWISIVYMTK